ENARARAVLPALRAVRNVFEMIVAHVYFAVSKKAPASANRNGTAKLSGTAGVGFEGKTFEANRAPALDHLDRRSDKPAAGNVAPAAMVLGGMDLPPAAAGVQIE